MPIRSSTSLVLHRKLRRMLAATFVLVMASTLGVGVQSATATSTKNFCEFAVFIGVRGTGAPAGATAAHSNRVWRAGGLGDQIAPLRNLVDDNVYPVWSASLNYPASTNYEASVSAGADTLTTELNYLASACGPYSPGFVLAGHSQGADVIARALSWGNWPNGVQLSQDAKNKIKAVVFYGDPRFYPGDTWNAPGSPSQQGLMPRNAILKEELKTYRFWGWPQGSTNPSPTWVSKIRSYCYAGDFFCQNNPNDSGFAIHNSYGSSTQTSKATSWIDYMLTDSN